MNLKTLSFLSIFFIMSSILHAQIDPISIEQTTEKKEQYSFWSAKKYKYLDRNFIEEKSLLRFGKYYDLSVSFEKKLSPSSSIYAGIHNDLYRQLYLGDRDFHTTNGLFTGYRYYYASNKKINEGKKANNLNGAFFALEYRRIFYNENVYSDDDYFPDEFINIIWGVQQRIGRYGAMGLNLNLTINPNSSNWFTLGSSFNAGLALGNAKRNQTREIPYFDYLSGKISRLTSQLKEDKGLFKFGISQFTASAMGASLDGVIAYEHKIIPPLSIIGEVEFLTYYSNGATGGTPTYYGTNLGLRYYYSLNKRIKRGLSANNFSANYLSIMGLNLNNGLTYLDNRRPTTALRFIDQGIGAYWGVQRKIKKLGYIDFQIGISHRERERTSTLQWRNPLDPTIINSITQSTVDYYWSHDIRIIYGFAK